MRKSVLCFLTVALAVVLAAPSNCESAYASPIDDPGVAAAIQVFDAWAEHAVQYRDQPGVSIGLVYDQELIWAKGYGYADLEDKTPATPATAYRIASLTKLFTATAVLQLRDAGKLQLDDPVVKHLDWFHLNDTCPDSPVITLRHMLSHTSGLPREFDGLYWDDMTFPDHEEFRKLFQEATTILPRETDYKYSNVAFAVLGAVVTAVSGEPYADYVTENILEPLDMTGTEVVPQADMPTLATGYKYRKPGQPREIEPFTDLKAMSSLGSIATTVEDLAKFLSLQFRSGPAGGAQILKGSTLREMHRVQWLDPEWETGHGLGWHLARSDDRTRIRHGGYVPGHTTSISAAPAEKFGVIVFTNAGDGRPGSYASKAWSIVAPAIQAASEEDEELAVADSAWLKFVGDYEWFDAAMTKVMLLDGVLAMVDPHSDDPWEDRIQLEPVSDGVFRMKDQWQKGELIRFEVDDSGNVTRLIMPGYALVRR